MLYVKPTKEGSWADYSEYFAYLESVKAKMPAHIAAFSSDEANYNLEHPNSLHDSWLLERVVRDSEITLKFLGSRHDRQIHLCYRGVTRCDFGNPGSRDDLLVHEMRIADGGVFAHEMLFNSGANVLIEFSGFEHRVILG